MITAVDTNVLLDVFLADPTFGPLSKTALQRCLDQGQLVACEVVWAELAGVFPSDADVHTAMKPLAIEYSSLEMEAAIRAGSAWRAYRKQGGKRDRVIGDFLVAAHAQLHADRLLTRDRGFGRKYFKGLRILDPSKD